MRANPRVGGDGPTIAGRTTCRLQRALLVRMPPAILRVWVTLYEKRRRHALRNECLEPFSHQSLALVAVLGVYVRRMGKNKA